MYNVVLEGTNALSGRLSRRPQPSYCIVKQGSSVANAFGKVEQDNTNECNSIESRGCSMKDCSFAEPGLICLHSTYAASVRNVASFIWSTARDKHANTFSRSFFLTQHYNMLHAGRACVTESSSLIIVWHTSRFPSLLPSALQKTFLMQV